MDARTTMIIAKGKFVTTDVADCIYHKENHKWEIVYKSGRSFFYNQQNVLYLKNPRNLDPKKFQVCRKGKILDNIETILSSIRSMVIKYHIEGVVIDYLQILTINKKSSNVEEAIAEAARRLKNIAKELNIWILALSQLSRDNSNPIPSVNRLRGSGQINEAADITILLYRPEVYNKRYSEPFQSTNPNGTALIDIAKGRNIGVFKFIAGFNAATTHFYELNERPILPLTESKDDNPF